MVERRLVTEGGALSSRIGHLETPVKALMASVSLILVVACGTLGLVAYLAASRGEAVAPSTNPGFSSVLKLAAATEGPSPTPRVVAAPTIARLAGEKTAASANVPLFSRSIPRPSPAVIKRAVATATAVPAARAGCDPAYPEARTCIPPGPPFGQGCAITAQRNFRVLPPDPQHLDADSDGIGCEPITSDS
jgi:hypothetical protein